MRKKNLPELYEVLPVPVVEFDEATMRILNVNSALTKESGHGSSTLTAHPLSSLLKDLPAPLCVDRRYPATLVHANGHSVSATVVYFNSDFPEGTRHFLVVETNFLNASTSELGRDEGAPRQQAAALVSRQSPNEMIELEAVVEAIADAIFIIADPSLDIVYANPAAERNLRYKSAELSRMRVTELFNFPDVMALNALLNGLRRKEVDRLSLQVRLFRKDGTSYDAQLLIQVLLEGRAFMTTAQDVSEKLQAEKRLRKTIDEKETLIKEIHHRVKNNLQLISSIIYLKLVSLVDSDIRSFLEDTRHKIRSIALIHERLLQTEDLNHIEIADYLGKLVNDLRITYAKPGLDLSMSTHIEERVMNIDTAIICGLIVNELITNALKHAFAGRTTGEMSIVFRFDDAAKKHFLSIADNGVSLPDHIGPERSSSYGMKLIDIFVKQLAGTFEIKRKAGTTFEIRF